MFPMLYPSQVLNPVLLVGALCHVSIGVSIYNENRLTFHPREEDLSSFTFINNRIIQTIY